MTTYPEDIYAESPTNPNTLAALGPLAPMAGVWEGQHGTDIAPKRAGPRTQAFHKRIELHPVDPRNNGPQTLYALRYHTWMCKPGETDYGICSNPYLEANFRTDSFEITVTIHDDGT